MEYAACSGWSSPRRVAGDFRAHRTAAAGGSLPAKGVALGLLKVMVVELQEKMNEDGDPQPADEGQFIDAAAIALKDHAQNAARDLQAIITAQNAGRWRTACTASATPVNGNGGADGPPSQWG